ncbi:hypothetical protein [Fluoribacter gormanii]|uniref:Uncharacterized protein n=1 Tax=Fluoribacter gormanii TaxID=464 RepID=A0A377GEZ7_9GAMM|nr:hypothetical protein [Fluoribacter gormanii]KTD04618.1 hypothetical protein Lgor_0982 [Fluoribacter gormanii]MCW8445058.1 hypothetical protein [Fluoribacter gormanii]SIR33811.1 hypothetical protein SAMN05421777_11093 [Fluoribacter gormanii]STO23376.1 Uncharacterised protein [Fluoribacter gormanii]
MKITKIGIKIALGDLFFSLIVPLFIYGLIQGDLRNEFVYPQVTLEFVTVLISTLLLLIVFADPLTKIIASWVRLWFRLFPRISRHFFLLFAIVYLIAAIVYFSSGLHFNRYDGISASSNLYRTFWVEIIFLGHAVLCAQVFYMIVARNTGIFSAQCMFGKSYWMLITIALLLTIDGMAQVILVGIILWYINFPAMFAKFINTPLLNGLKYKFFALILAILLFVLGIAFKERGLPSDPALLLDYYISKIIWLIDRLSTIYFSTGFAINSHSDNPEIVQKAWEIISNEINFRFCVVFNDGNCSVFKDSFGSISRFNFSNILINDSGRGGASPGVLGATAYLFPLYLVPLITVFYYSIVAAIMDVVVGTNRPITVTVVGVVVYGYLLRGLYLNPAALINPLSSPMIAMVVFIIVSLYFYQNRRNIP